MLRRSAWLVLVAVGCGPRVDATPPSQAPKGEEPRSTVDAELRDEINAMHARDQGLQKRLFEEELSEAQREQIIGELKTVQADNDRRFAELVASRGWPGRALVGDEAAQAAVFLALHASREHQARYLALAKQAAQSGGADPAIVAVLEDRVLLEQGKPQRYGTQAECGADGTPFADELLDPATVDDRRASVGLPPLSEYLAEMEQHCIVVPDAWD